MRIDLLPASCTISCSIPSAPAASQCTLDDKVAAGTRGGRGAGDGRRKHEVSLVQENSAQTASEGLDDVAVNRSFTMSKAFYLPYHSDIIPHSRSVIHSHWLHFGRWQEATRGALLSEQGHTCEQVGCRTVQGELDLQGYHLSAQPATWMQMLQSGHSIKPDDDIDNIT